jgi:hypothetical protein
MGNSISPKGPGCVKSRAYNIEATRTSMRFKVAISGEPSPCGSAPPAAGRADN